MKGKHIILIIISLLTISSCNSDKNSNNNLVDNSVFRQIIIDLNSDKSKDTILLLNPETSGDPGSFKRIKILGKDIQTFELSANFAWDTILKSLRNKNEPSIKSNFIFIKRHGKSTYLLLTGWKYPTGQEDFALIGVSKNKCTVLTRENFFDIDDISDQNNDGLLEITLNPTGSETIQDIDTLNASIMSYAPFYVYSLTPTSFLLDTGLTANYNLKNYTWSGLENPETKKVILYKDKNKYHLWND